MTSGEENKVMDKDQKPASVLGWLTTSANYPVVSSSAPAEHQSGHSKTIAVQEAPSSAEPSTSAESPGQK